MIRYLNQPGTPLSKKQPFTFHNNFPAMVTLLIESMNKSPTKRSNFIVVKVVHGGDRSPQYEIRPIVRSVSRHVRRHFLW